MEYIKRSDWGARQPKGRSYGELNKPSTGHWNGLQLRVRGQLTWDHSVCASLVRGVQNFHMDGRGWRDIAYNFVVCPHGVVFEGRGLNIINGGNGTNDGNRTSHAIMCLAGEGNPFPDAEKRGFRECVRYIDRMTAAPDKCIGHRDHKPTACPGDERYRWIHAGMLVPGVVPQPTPTPTPPSVRRTLKMGMNGEDVKDVQRVIREKAGGNIKVDGIFGLQTKTRVQDLQRFFKINADGVVESKTWGVIDFLRAKKQNAFGDWPTKPKSVLRRGSTGNEVRYLQSVITMRAGGGLLVDGSFGDETVKRVKDVQRFFSISADGIVGPQTWSVIDFLANS